MVTLLNDIKHGLRALTKAPGFTATAVLILALGIGANTAIFSVVYAFMIRPLPYDHPEELVTLYEKSAQQGISQFSVAGPKYLAWRSDNHVFQEMGALSVRSATLGGTGEPASVVACEVTPSCLAVFRFRTRLGRLFAEEEDQPGRDQVVILSQTMWQSQCGGREDIIGRDITLDGRRFTVAGVLAGGGLANWEGGEVLFIPLSAARMRHGPEQHYYQVFGRLKPGVSLAQCRVQMEALTGQVNQAEPRFRDWMPSIVSFREDNLGNWPGWQTELLLQGAVAAVLLLACFNAACLLLVRAIGRRRELAIRLAVGGTRWQVIRQLLLESTLLAIAGGLLGLLFSFWGVQAATHWLSTQSIVFWTDVRCDRMVLAFSFALSVVAGLVSGILPAWQTTRLDPQSTLKATGGSASATPHRTLNAMAVAQITLSFLLLVTAALFVRNLVRLRGLATGYDPHNLLTVETSLAAKRLPGASPDLFIETAMDRLKALPQVQSVAAADGLVDYGAVLDFWVEGREYGASGPGPLNQTQLRRVSPGYFHAMGLGILKGRPFTQADRRGSEPVAILNETLAQRFFPGENPIGAYVQTGKAIENRYRVIGVSGAERLAGPSGALEPMVYVPLQGWSGLEFYTLALAVRTKGGSAGLEKAIKQELRALDPDAVFRVRALDTRMEGSLMSQRLTSFVFAAFALTALLLLSLGIYSVIAHLVSRRAGEFGIRMALGAQRGEILRRVLAQGLFLAFMGTALGFVAAILLTRVLGHFLFDFNPKDPVTFVCVTFLSFVVAMLACWLPAWRATRVDPMEALRCE